MNELWSSVSIEEMLMQLVFGDHCGSGCVVVIVVIHGWYWEQSWRWADDVALLSLFHHR